MLKKIIIVISLAMTTSHGVSLSIIPGENVKLEKGKEIEFQKPINKEPKKKLASTKIIKDAKKYLGVRYRFGGTTRKGIDCSAFVRAIYKKQGKNLPRTSYQQASSGKHVDKKNLKKGDLVFFKGTYKRGISHVGIYLGNDKFIHASSGARKVTISKLSKSYYRRHYAGARRIS